MSKRPFEIERLDHLVLRTTDIERLVAFYEGFGFAVARRVDKLGLVQLRAGASMIDIIDVTGAVAEMGGSTEAPDLSVRNMDHFAVRVNPFNEEEILAFCAAQNIQATPLPFPLYGADGFGPSIYATDPDGNVFELKGPPNEDQTDPLG